MSVGLPVLNTNYEHSNSSVNMEIDKIITMLMVVTMAVTMKWRENLLPTCYDHSEMNTNVIFKNMLFRTK